MSKRKSNVHQRFQNTSDSEPNYSDSENEPVRKKARYYSTRSRCVGNKNVHQKLNKREENEHSYSSPPIFNKIDINNDHCSYSSESDYENNDIRESRFSERSTSLESIKSKGKSVRVSSDLNNADTQFSSKRKPKCFSKNAVMARMNRQKKKQYVEKLECDIDDLKNINKEIKLELDEHKELVTRLKNEIRYLRSALANTNEIGRLIRRVCNVGTDVKVTSPLLDSTPPERDNSLTNCSINEDDNGLQWPTPIDNSANISNDLETCDLPPIEIGDLDQPGSFGLCLHVTNNHLSFEFCESCNRSALLGVLGDQDLPMVKCKE